MGWACSASMKRQMLFTASKHHVNADDETACENSFRAVVIDVNACFRQMVAPNGICKLSPRCAVSIFFKNYVSRYPNASVVVFAFDSPHLVPEERLNFHRTKRYAKATRKANNASEVLANDGRIYKIGLEPIEDHLIEMLTPDNIPGGVWDRFWNSAKGKSRLWDIVEQCLVDIIQTWAPSKCYIIDSQDGRRSFYPSSLRYIKYENIPSYGEGDTKTVLYALSLKSYYYPVVICSIDWDMAIQVMICRTEDIVVRIGNVYRVQESVFYSMGSAKKSKGGTPQRCIEYIDCTRLMNLFPSRAHRLEAAFWAMCAGGVDYCSGLAAFGLNESMCFDLVKQCTDDSLEPMFEEGRFVLNPLRRVLRFRVRAFLHRILMINHKKPRNDSITDFSKEIQQIVFCLKYYMFFDPTRPRPGPIVETDHLFPSAPSVSELYTGKYFVQDLLFYEDYALNDTLFCDPQFIFAPKIAQRIDLQSLTV